MMKLHPWLELYYYNSKLLALHKGKLKESIFDLLDKYKIKELDDKINELTKKDDLDAITKLTSTISSFRKEARELISSLAKQNINDLGLKQLKVTEINANIILSNFVLLYFLEKDLRKIGGVKKYITNFKRGSYNYLRPIFIKPVWGSADLVIDKIYQLNYLALKWFYSDKTKHLYSKELLNEMKDYEAKIKNVAWEDCIKKPSKYDRLIID